MAKTMQVIVRVLFDRPTDNNVRDMRNLAQRLSADPDDIRVAADPEAPGWLVAEFSMPAAKQLSAVSRIDGVLAFEVENRLNSTIAFPRSAAEEARARRKNERRKALRKMKRESQTPPHEF